MVLPKTRRVAPARQRVYVARRRDREESFRRARRHGGRCPHPGRGAAVEADRCSRFRARFGSRRTRRSPASANPTPPTAGMACASCCSCSPYSSARPNGSASAGSIGRGAARRSRPACCGVISVVLPAVLLADRGHPTHAQHRQRVPTTPAWSPAGRCSLWSDLLDHRRGRSPPTRARIRHRACCKPPAACFGFVLGSPLGLGPCPTCSPSSFSVVVGLFSLADDYRHPRHRFAGGCAQNRR